jgi:hypothetical protein
MGMAPSKEEFIRRNVFQTCSANLEIRSPPETASSPARDATRVTIDRASIIECQSNFEGREVSWNPAIHRATQIRACGRLRAAAAHESEKSSRLQHR